MNNSSCNKIAFISDQSGFKIVDSLVAKCNLTNIFWWIPLILRGSILYIFESIEFH